MTEVDPCIARALSGDMEAVAALLIEFGPGLQAQLARDFPKRHQSLVSLEDLLQDITAEAFLCIGSAAIRSRGQFFAWMQTLASRHVKDVVRYLEAQKRAAPSARLGDSSQALLTELVADSAATASRTMSRNEALQLLREALARLPEDQRRAIQHYRLDGLPIEQVAAVLGRSAGAVHLLVNRGQQRLRDLLDIHQSVIRFIA